MFKQLEQKYNIKFLFDDTILVSYPKSGRTWVRMILAKILVDGGYDYKLYEFMPTLHKTPDEILNRFSKDIKVIFLHRDPGDVVISYYHEMRSSFRSGVVYMNALEKFLQNEKYGIDACIDFNNIWFDNASKFKKFLSITYEALKISPQEEMEKVLNFLNYDYPADKLKEAIGFSSFSNMKKIENGVGENYLKHYKGNFGGDSSGRVRRGKVKGYLDLENHIVDYIEYRKKRITYLEDE